MSNDGRCLIVIYRICRLACQPLETTLAMGATVLNGFLKHMERETRGNIANH